MCFTFTAVFSNNNVPFSGDVALMSQPEVTEDLVLLSGQANNKLPCDLTSAASEFPVLWFKDGVLVKTKDKCTNINKNEKQVDIYVYRTCMSLLLGFISKSQYIILLVKYN